MRYVLTILLLSLSLVTGCSKDEPSTTATPPPSATAPSKQTTPSSAVKSLPPTAAKKLIDSRENLLIIDVRAPEELQREGAIENSTLIPFWEILRGKQTLPKDRPLLLVCAVGGRSYAIGQILQRQGYSELYNLQGGIDAWKKAGLPLQY